jgi:hypothetical protein
VPEAAEQRRPAERERRAESSGREERRRVDRPGASCHGSRYIQVVFNPCCEALSLR